MLERDFKVDVNGQEARLRLVSVQNKFDHLEATHLYALRCRSHGCRLHSIEPQ